MDIKEINNLIQQQFELSPIDFSEPTAINAEMRQALAEAWSKEGFRKYLSNAINKLVVNSATKSINEVDMSARKGGILFLKQFMMICESCYYDYAKLKKITKK